MPLSPHVRTQSAVPTPPSLALASFAAHQVCLERICWGLQIPLRTLPSTTEELSPSQEPPCLPQAASGRPTSQHPLETARSHQAEFIEAIARPTYTGCIARRADTRRTEGVLAAKQMRWGAWRAPPPSSMGPWGEHRGPLLIAPWLSWETFPVSPELPGGGGPFLSLWSRMG